MEDEEDPAEKTVNDKLLKEFVPSLVTAILARRSVPPAALSLPSVPRVLLLLTSSLSLLPFAAI